MNIPYSDNLKIEYLSRIFDRKRISTSYKYFWMMAILELISMDRSRFTYNELVNHMIADAWYMVNEYHLRLGPCNTKDNLEEVVKYLYEQNLSGMSSNASKERLLKFLENCDDKLLAGYKRELIINVPYCLQSPFYDGLKNPRKEIIAEINKQERLMYYFGIFKKFDTEIVISDEWVEYLVRNKNILMDWVRYNLIGYLQDRNPSLPGIADKIVPPSQRDLKHARDYWSTMIKLDPGIAEIYGGNLMIENALSVDHFVPWQYVSHDELWNLHPTTKSINSAKSNNLADWNVYFEPLLRLEFRMYELCNSDERAAKAFKKCADYHLNSPDIRSSLYAPGLSQVQFGERLFKVIRPVYESAINYGFKEWTYNGSNNI